MKSPLRYQMTEYDSGVTALLNGISYLVEREKINPILVSSLYRYTLDSQNISSENNETNYTSKAIFHFLSKYINEFDKNLGYKLHFDEVSSEKLDMKFIQDCISNNSSLILPIWENNKERYVTLTNVDKENAYIFDPYYMNEESDVFKFNKDIIYETEKPMEYNRIISKDRLFGFEIPFSIYQSMPCYIITSNYQKEGVHIAKKFDYIYDRTKI